MNQSYYRVVNSHLAVLALSESVEVTMVRSVRKTVSAGRSWLGPGGKYLTQESLHGSHLNAAAAAAKSLQSCLTLCDPIDGSHQAPLSLGFSREEHWSGLPFPSPMHESEK